MADAEFDFISITMDNIHEMLVQLKKKCNNTPYKYAIVMETDSVLITVFGSNNNIVYQCSSRI